MPRLTELAQKFCRRALSPGDVAIDATAGNGHDTLFLARAVGPDGIVYVFDLQPAAINATSCRLADAGMSNVVLQRRDHAQLREAVTADHQGRVAAVMFNLGYLPGGDHALITQPASTIAALRQSLALLRPGGVLTVLAYTGHAGGAEEADAVRDFFDSLDGNQWTVVEVPGVESRCDAPRLFVAKRQAT